MPIGKPVFTKQYARYGIRPAKAFQKTTFRTHDIGRPKHSKRIAGKLKKTGKWATKSMLITRSDYKKGYRVKMKYNRPTITMPTKAFRK